MMKSSVYLHTRGFLTENGVKITKQWTLSIFLLIGAALWSSTEAAQFNTADCPAGTFYKTGTKYFEEKTYNAKPRLVGDKQFPALFPSPS